MASVEPDSFLQWAIDNDPELDRDMHCLFVTNAMNIVLCATDRDMYLVERYMIDSNPFRSSQIRYGFVNLLQNPMSVGRQN